uniref:tudor domain-containing protein 3-like n=1 Tax=Styela clava TaxID=7725 RepID=UPI00193958D0|nr:tudor domain-containing protein 3-like [Styela clava]
MESIGKILEDEGWHLKESALNDLQKNLSDKEELTYGKIKKLALDTDLSNIGYKYIQEKISCTDNLLVGPVVLQVSKIRNITAPKENEYSNIAPRMLRVTLTDGVSTITGIEYEHIEQISLKTAPGTKIRLIGSIAVTHGQLQLEPGSVKILGGRVEKLYTRWKIALDAAGLSRAGIVAEGAPPPFVAFGKNIQKYNKSNKSLKGDTKHDEAEDDEFNEQRKAAIAEVAKASVQVSKTFSSDVRANFGKRPTSAPSYEDNKSSSDPVHKDSRPKFSKQPLSNEEKTNSQNKSARIYRELSTQSGENVHLKTVNEFVEMGFKRDDVVFFMQKCDNDFESTMEMLVANANAEDSQKERQRGHRGRGDNRGFRRGNRGRGRGRSFHEEEENEHPMSQPSNSATLFDFVESKISVPEPSKKQNGNDYYKKSYQNEASNQRNDNKNWYQESNRGYNSRSRGGNRRFNERGRGRGGGRMERREDRRENDSYKSRGYNKWESHSDNPQKFKTYDKRLNDSKTDEPYGQGRSGKIGRESDITPKNDSQMTEKDSRNERMESGKRYSSTRASENPRRSQDTRNEGNTQSRESDKNRTSGHQNQHRVNERHASDIPPRFKKGNSFVKNENIKHTAIPHFPQNTMKGESNSKLSGEASEFNINQNFRDLSINPPPSQRGPTTFGTAAPNTDTSIHININQSTPSHDVIVKSHSNGPQVHVSLPKFYVGSHCLARYWEDRCYYRAIITDLHPTAPTAVVQFLGFGNYEEVQLFDMKPFDDDKTSFHGATQFSHNRDNGQNLPYMGNPQRPRQNSRPGKPPLQLYVPPKSRNSS